MPFVPGAIAAVSAWTVTFAGVQIGVGAFLVNTVSSLAMSALATAIRGRPEVRTPGITTQTTTAGGTIPQRLIFGRYATAGQMVAPMMVYQSDGNPNEWLVYVISLADKPVTGLGRIFVDGKALTIDGNPAASQHGDTMGATVLDTDKDSLRNKIYVRFHDGRQTAADAYLRRVFGTYPERPWTADMIGTGVAYAVVTFKGKAQDGDYSGFPAIKFEVDGHPLYDPRDATQDPGNEATWKFTHNAAVMAYNVLRGIDMPGGGTWGVGTRKFHLPSVIAAMNLCDQQVPRTDGTMRPRYQAGLEVSVSDEPHQALMEFVKAMGGDVADMGGTWLLAAGEPGGAVLSITDDDIIVTDSRSLKPYPGLDETINAIHASYPDPAQQWEAKEAVPIYNAAFEAADGGRRLIAELDFPAVPYPQQVRALMGEMLADHRRMRTHVITLPPDALGLKLGDHDAWTSESNFYTNKLFKISALRVDPLSLCVAVTKIERDPSDYDDDAARDGVLPTVPSPEPVTPVIVGVTGWDVEPVNAGGRPGIRMIWDPEINARALSWVIRLASDNSIVNNGSTADLSAGAVVVTAGLIGNTAYRVTGRLVMSRQTEQTAMVTVTTLDIGGVNPGDIDTTPPDRPNPPTLTSTPGKLVATWTPTADTSYSDLEITEAGGNALIFQTSGSRYEWTGVLSGVAYTVRRRAVDRVGNRSDWSDPATHTVAADTVPPATPTGLALTPGFGSIWARWNANAEPDMAQYELYVSATTTAPAAGATATYTTLANNYLVLDIPAQTTRHFWVRAVDTSGNKSPWSARVQATTPDNVSVTTADLQGVIDATSFANGIEPVTIHAGTSLPTTKSTTSLLWNGKLYRWDGTKYSPDVLGQDAVTAGTVAAGAINTRELAAGAVTASILGVGDFTNLVPDNELQDQAAWSGPGVIQPSSGATWANSLGRMVFNPNPAADQISLSRPFSVTVGDEFWVTFQASFATAATVMNSKAVIYWYDRDGVLLDGQNRDIAFATSRSQQTYENATSIVVPSGAFTARMGLWVAKETNGQAYFYAPTVRRKNAGKLIVDGAIKANHLTTDEAVITGTAQIANAVVTSAHIVDLVASKIRGGTALLSTITVNGTALGTSTDRAADPAARVNAHTTQIEPGRIRVSGSTTLADWRFGGDETLIDGGRLGVNSVRANSLEIGSRNITVENITFSYNRAANSVSWTAGAIRYPEGTGTFTANIPAGSSSAWTSGNILYIVYTRGTHVLWATTSQASAMNSDVVILATYTGAERLNSYYGRTLIDGWGVQADNLLIRNQAQIDTAVITNAHIENLTIGPDKVQVDGLSKLWDVSFADTQTSPHDAAWVEVGRLSVTAFAENTKLFVLGQGLLRARASTQGVKTVEMRVLINGTVVYRRVIKSLRYSPDPNLTEANEEWISILGMQRSMAGANSIVVQVRQTQDDSSQPAHGSLGATSLYVMEFKR